MLIRRVTKRPKADIAFWRWQKAEQHRLDALDWEGKALRLEQRVAAQRVIISGLMADITRLQHQVADLTLMQDPELLESLDQMRRGEATPIEWRRET